MRFLITLLLLLSRSIDLSNLDDDDYWDALDIDPYEDDGIDFFEDEQEDVIDRDALRAQKCIVKNPSQYEIDIYFRTEGDTPIIYFFSTKPGAEQTINTFVGHTFYAVLKNTKTLIETWKITEGITDYVVNKDIDEFDGEDFDAIPLNNRDEVDAELELEGAEEPGQVRCPVRNTYDFAIDVYWKAPNGENHFIFSVDAKASHNVNTYVGHRFAAKKINTEVELSLWTVEQPEETIHFGPMLSEEDDDEDLDLDDFGYEDDEENEENEDQANNKEASGVDWNADDELDLDLDLDLSELDDFDSYSPDGTCSADDETCNVYAPKASLAEPLLSKWESSKANPYQNYKGFPAKFRNLNVQSVELVRNGQVLTTLRSGGSTTLYVKPTDIVVWKDSAGTNLKESIVHMDQPFYVLTGDNTKWNSLHKKEMKLAKEHYKETGRVLLVSANTEIDGFLWYASQVGQKHRISTTNGYFSCSPINLDDDCFGKKSFRIRLVTVSLTPRAFEVQSFLSTEEVQYLLSLEQDMVSRDASKVIERIYGRTADLLRTKKLAAADLKVLSLNNGDKLSPQLGFDVQDCPNLQFATLFVFLSEPSGGGKLVLNNASPKVQLELTVGTGLLLQSRLPDGNVDPFSIYSFTKVIGDMKIAVIQVWEPKVGCDGSKSGVFV